MKIILTGASGFLGKYLASYFSAEELITVGRKDSMVNVYLDQDIPVLPAADLVIHSAGKAHVVPKTKAEAEEFYAVNVKGTKNLLTSLEQADKLPAAFVFISSIAVYGRDTGHMIPEGTPLLAEDPYGKSKIEAEKLVEQWCSRFDIPYAILRLPLIAGQQPPGNLNSMIQAIKRGYYFNIGGGKARKSMVMAASIPSVILPAIAAGGIFNLTDGYHPSFSELSSCISEQLGKPKPMNMPFVVAKSLASLGNIIGKRFPLNSKKYQKMINDLTFDDAKARQSFGWKPSKVIDNFKI